MPGEAPRALITTGPYRLTRNPMYAGLAVAYAGDAIAIPEFWALVFLPLVLAYVNWSVIPVEEASLNGVPGYAGYRARVRRWIEVTGAISQSRSAHLRTLWSMSWLSARPGRS